MKLTGQISLDCIKQLLPNLAASGLWGAGVVAAPLLGTTVALPALVGIGCVAAYIGLTRVCTTQSEEDERHDLAAALSVIRKRTANTDKELAALGYQLQFSVEDVHSRLSSLDSAIERLFSKIDNLDFHFRDHRNQFDDLCFFLQINFDALKPFLAALPTSIEELKHDIETANRRLAQIEVSQAKQPTNEDLQKMKAELLAAINANRPSDAPVRPSMQHDLVAAVERLVHDAALGGMTARGVLASERPSDMAIYLDARRTQLDAAHNALNQRLAQEKLNLDREIAAVCYLTGRIDQAIAALNRILSALPNDLSATVDIGSIYLLRGNLVAAEQQFRRLIDLTPGDTEFDASWHAAAYGNLGSILHIRGHLEEAEAMQRKSLEINVRLGHLEGMAAAYGNIGLTLESRGQLEAAEIMIRNALVAAERLDDEGCAANQYSNLGLVLRSRNDLDGSESMHRRALAMYERLGQPLGMAIQYGNLGIVFQQRGNLHEAEALHRKSLAIEEQLGRLEGMASDYGNIGKILHLRNDLIGAESMYRKALEINERIGRFEGIAIQCENLAIIFEIRGDLAGAEALRQRVLAANAILGRVQGSASDYTNLGIAVNAHGDLDGAEALHRKALALDEQRGCEEGIASDYANLGSVAKQRGDLAGARRLWTDSQERFAKLGANHEAENIQRWLDNLPPQIAPPSKQT